MQAVPLGQCRHDRLECNQSLYVWISDPLPRRKFMTDPLNLLMAGEVLGPRRVPNAVVLINEQVVKLSFKYLYLYS